MNITTILIGLAIVIIVLKCFKFIGKVVSSIALIIATIMLVEGLFGVDIVGLLVGIFG